MFNYGKYCFFIVYIHILSQDNYFLNHYDGLDPETGTSTNTFTYRVKYADFDNDTPANGYPKVHIKKGGVEISGSPFPVRYISGNYNTGAIYSYAKNGLSAGTDYTYYFEAYDVWNASATGTPITAIDAPDVSQAASTYTLTIDINPSGGGSVSKNPDQSTYTAGSQVTLTATVNIGYTFSSWSGDTSGSTNPTTITMNSNKSVTANFTVSQPTATYYVKGYVRRSSGAGIEGVNVVVSRQS